MKTENGAMLFRKRSSVKVIFAKLVIQFEKGDYYVLTYSYSISIMSCFCHF